jgi:ABC-type lipopolysaccharide export system ATPase subunit
MQQIMTVINDLDSEDIKNDPNVREHYLGENFSF